MRNFNSKFSWRFVLNSINGRIIRGIPDIPIGDVSTDSRHISSGALFFALKGDKFDGHDYVREALIKGASAVVISDVQKVPDRTGNGVIIQVSDTLKALQDLAMSYRDLFMIPVIAVTGSVGKTTTKDILAECLSYKYQTLKTRGNFNNEIGLPLTLLELEKYHQAAVVELAMRKPLEIYNLSLIVKPNCAIISNIEPVHLETMGTMENIAEAKCEVLKVLGEKDFALINGDNDLLLEKAGNCKCRLYTFGHKPDCDFRIVDLDIKGEGMEIRIDLMGSIESFFFPLPARKLATNIVSAAGVAYLMNISIDKIKKGIASYSPSNQRLNIKKLSEGGAIINDTYNANPISMKAGVELLKELSYDKKSIAVLGDMFELGSYEYKGHREVGQAVAEMDIDILIAIGNRAQDIVHGAKDAGMSMNKIFYFQKKEESLRCLINNFTKEDVILFKASRGMRLEELLDELNESLQ